MSLPRTGIIFLLFFCAVYAQGAVFELRGGDSQHAIFPAIDNRTPMTVWSERMIINGYETKLSVRVCFGSAMSRFKYWSLNAPAANCIGNKPPMRIDIAQKGGERRILLFQTPSQQDNCMEVEMFVPDPLPPPSWPRELPRPSSAQATRETAFPDRATYSVSFTSDGSVNAALQSLCNACEHSNYARIHAGINADGSASGFYYSAEEKACVMFAVSTNASGATDGIMIRSRAQ